MTTTTLELVPGRWLASDATVRVNYTDRDGGDATRSVRVTHYLQGDHTACGRHTAGFAWTEPAPDAVVCRFCSGITVGHATHHTMRAAADITYRQLDWWSRRGWLRPDPGPGGSGTRRTWSPVELAVAVRMGELTRAGVAASVAAVQARDEVEHRAPRDLALAWNTERGELT